MNEQERADKEQLYGPLYCGDFPLGSHVTYLRFDGKVAQGTVVWIQEPGRATGRDGKTLQFHVQYVIEPDLPGSFVDFANETAILLVD